MAFVAISSRNSESTALSTFILKSAAIIVVFMLLVSISGYFLAGILDDLMPNGEIVVQRGFDGHIDVLTRGERIADRIERIVIASGTVVILVLMWRRRQTALKVAKKDVSPHAPV